MKQWAWAVGLALISCSLGSAPVLAADSTSISNSKTTQSFIPATSPAFFNAPVGTTQGVQSYYADQVSSSIDLATVTPAFINSLPVCPGDPSSTAVTTRSVCPDINGKWTETLRGTTIYQGTSAYNNDGSATPDVNVYCPDLCTVSRYVHYTTMSGPSGNYQGIDQYKPAACPTNYSQVAATNVDYDITYSSSGFTVIPTNDAERANLVNQGASCVDGTTYNTSYCAYSTSMTSKSDTNPCADETYGTYKDTSNILRYGRMTSCQNVMVAHTTYGCYLQGTACVTLQVPAGGTAPALCSSLPHSTYFMNQFTTISCAVPAGYYKTTNTVPTKVVCSHIKTVWQKRY